MSTPSRVLRASESVTYATLDDEAVLLDVQQGLYFGLDDVGTHIWEQVAKGATEAEIVRGIVNEYEVAPEQAARDVADFVATLQARGLVQWADS